MDMRAGMSYKYILFALQSGPRHHCTSVWNVRMTIFHYSNSDSKISHYGASSISTVRTYGVLPNVEDDSGRFCKKALWVLLFSLENRPSLWTMIPFYHHSMAHTKFDDDLWALYTMGHSQSGVWNIQSSAIKIALHSSRKYTSFSNDLVLFVECSLQCLLKVQNLPLIFHSASVWVQLLCDLQTHFGLQQGGVFII